MSLNTNDPRDIMQFVNDQLSAPVYFPKFAAAEKPMTLRWRYHAIYITDTSKPAWMDSAGAWRYADGTAV